MKTHRVGIFQVEGFPATNGAGLRELSQQFELYHRPWKDCGQGHHIQDAIDFIS